MALVGRRAWLSLVGGGAAATAAGAHVRSAGAREGIVAADPRIKHIVVLMLENRSFHHMLGLLMRDILDFRGIRGGDYSNRDKNGTRFDVTDGAEYQGQFRARLRGEPRHDAASQPGLPIPACDGGGTARGFILTDRPFS